MKDMFSFISELTKTLSAPELAHLNRRHETLIDRNCALGGSSDGFRYKGIIYSRLVGRSRSMGTYSLLHASLVPEMESILNDQKTLDQDMRKIRQALALVLEGCKIPQDIRDALPNCLKEMVPGITQLERTRPEAFTLAENSKLYNQYMKLRERIEYYSVSRLLY